MTGIYIHIPFCKSKCNYCAFYSVAAGHEIMTRYLNALFCEMDTRTDRMHKISADTLYIGGGTPSVLPRGFLTQMIGKVRERFLLTSDAEITVESNPESCTAELCAELKAAGVNRISLGLQSHDDAVLKDIGRPHGAADFLRAAETAEKAGIFIINADIMLGLPGQSLQSVLDSIDFVIGASGFIRHISLYALSVENGTPLDRRGYRADEDMQAEMYDTAVQKLQNSGFWRYEVSNFAQKDCESRHNLKYWTGEPYFGFGAGAHSFQPNLLHNMAVRTENWADLDRYISGDFEGSRIEISANERAEEILMLRLRMRDGLDLLAFQKETGRNLLKEKRQEIETLLKSGMLHLEANRLTVTDQGYYVLNSILVKLL